MKKQHPLFGEGVEIDVTTPAYLQVCLTEGDGTGISIPLKDLVTKLEEYVNTYGGQGALRIEIYYKDKNEDIKPLYN